MIKNLINLTLLFTVISTIILIYTDSGITSANDGKICSRIVFNQKWLFSHFVPLPERSMEEEPVRLKSILYIKF
jgi:hypothetical protein